MLLTLLSVSFTGLQGAGDSPHRHHIPHRLLLLHQLCEGGHICDDGARLLRLSPGGKNTIFLITRGKSLKSERLKESDKASFFVLSLRLHVTQR